MQECLSPESQSFIKCILLNQFKSQHEKWLVIYLVYINKLIMSQSNLVAIMVIVNYSNIFEERIKYFINILQADSFKLHLLFNIFAQFIWKDK